MNNYEGVRVCSKCASPKTNKHSWCNTCLVKYTKEWLSKHPEKKELYYQLYKKPWIARNKDHYLELHRKNQKNYNKKFPEKLKAHNLTRLKYDELKNDNCEKCGIQRELELHHLDYTQPLLVVTLCRECHRKETWKHE